MIQSLIWRFRWTFDKRWRESTKRRCRRDKAASDVTGKAFKMTALRRFVVDRLG